MTTTAPTTHQPHTHTTRPATHEASGQAQHTQKAEEMTTAPTIPQDTARHVLWFYGHDGGARPGTFTQKLIATIDAADMANTGLLANAYPSLVAAVIAAKCDPDGIDALKRIAGPIQCARCGDTDGPWVDDLCEDCNRVVFL